MLVVVGRWPLVGVDSWFAEGINLYKTFKICYKFNIEPSVFVLMLCSEWISLENGKYSAD